MLRKDIQHIGRQNERSYRGFGLGLGDLGLCAFLDHLPSDVELTCSEVDVLPLKTEYLPSAHTRGQLEEEELVVSFLVCLDQKPSDLVLCQHLHLLCLFGWQSATDCRIGCDQTFRHCLFKCRSAGGMAGAHHSVGQALAVIFYKSASAPFLQPRVELLQIVLRQLTQRYFPDFGDDVVGERYPRQAFA